MDAIYQFYFGYHEVVSSWVLPAALAAASLVGGWLSQRRQEKHNKELAQFQASANEQYLNQQLNYNTPAAQMMRYRDAGLNPHLIYGQGSPGNQSAPLTFPDIKPTDYQSSMSSLGPLINQSMMVQSQVQANNAKTNKTYVETQLKQLEKEVLAKNPLLDEAGFRAIIDSLISTARIKGAESQLIGQKAEFMTGEKSFYDEKTGKTLHGPAGALMLEKQLDLLNQKFDLGAQDQKVKAQIIASKEFQNELLEIQRDWMKEGDITPQHIYQFVQLLLMKLLQR